MRPVAVPVAAPQGPVPGTVQVDAPPVAGTSNETREKSAQAVRMGR